MDSDEIRVDTSRRRVVDLTEAVNDFCQDKGDGLVSLLAPHATAGLALMELGSGSEADLDQLVDRLLPRHDRYRHRHGSVGHGADHLLPVLVSPSLVLPVHVGRPLLGRWQSVVFVDYNSDNAERYLRLSFLTG
jgi:secondary thiamine-phosphate synthase enzyme